MTECERQGSVCQFPDVAAAYLDGELEDEPCALFEAHLKACAACAAVLAEQRRLLCLLDNVFGHEPEKQVPLPENFAEVITAHARSDMHGICHRREQRRALLFCLALAAASFALLGAANFDAALRPIAGLAGAVASVAAMFTHAFFNVVASLVVVLRAAGGQLTTEPPPIRFLTWILFAGAVVLLWRLISSYHRRSTHRRSE